MDIELEGATDVPTRFGRRHLQDQLLELDSLLPGLLARSGPHDASSLDRRGVSHATLGEARQAPPPFPTGVVIVPGDSFYRATISPPYTDAFPEEPQVAETEPPGIYQASFSRGDAQTGEISLGVGAGVWRDHHYPAPGSWLFGRYASSIGGIRYDLQFPSPLEGPVGVRIAAKVQVGTLEVSEAPTAIQLHEGAGFAAAVGWVHLVLDGWPSFDRPRGIRRRFLEWAESESSQGRAGGPPERRVTVEDTIWMAPGAASVMIAVEADVWALVGVAESDEVSGGFAAINMTAPSDGASFCDLNVSLGPITVTGLEVELYRGTVVGPR